LGRPKKQTVDYFPHYCVHKKTMFIIEQKYGNDGYAFWFKLLELLGSSEGHYLKLENGMDWEFLIAKTRLDKNRCTEILNLLAILGAIDRELWEEHNIIWSDNFVENLKDAYRNRVVDIPAKPSFSRKKSYKYKDNQRKKSTNEMKVNEMKVNENTDSSDLKEKSEQKTEINFNFKIQKWEGITKEDLSLWAEAYPACDIKQELKKMIAWILSAGAKGKKRRWRKFITNWLSRQQDRGGTKPLSYGKNMEVRYEKVK